MVDILDRLAAAVFSSSSGTSASCNPSNGDGRGHESILEFLEGFMTFSTTMSCDLSLRVIGRGGEVGRWKAFGLRKPLPLSGLSKEVVSIGSKLPNSIEAVRDEVLGGGGIGDRGGRGGVARRLSWDFVRVSF